jgi:hypothetical protein
MEGPFNNRVDLTEVIVMTETCRKLSLDTPFQFIQLFIHNSQFSDRFFLMGSGVEGGPMMGDTVFLSIFVILSMGDIVVLSIFVILSKSTSIR